MKDCKRKVGKYWWKKFELKNNLSSPVKNQVVGNLLIAEYSSTQSTNNTGYPNDGNQERRVLLTEVGFQDSSVRQIPEKKKISKKIENNLEKKNLKKPKFRN